MFKKTKNRKWAENDMKEINFAKKKIMNITESCKKKHMQRK